MDSLCPEMVCEIFMRMDPITARALRSSSRNLNQIFLNNRKYLPKPALTLYIVKTDESIQMRNAERICPILTLAINRNGPDDEAIKQFDLLEIVGMDKEMIVFETADLGSSLDKILGNMQQHYFLEIVVKDRSAFYSMCGVCPRCLWPTPKGQVDEVGRLVCYSCRDKQAQRPLIASGRAEENEERFRPSGSLHVCNYSLLLMKAAYERYIPAVPLTIEEIIDRIRRETPDFKDQRIPLRMKYSPEKLSELRRFVHANCKNELQSIEGHRSGSRLADEQLRRVEIWASNSDEITMVLAHNEIFVCNSLQIGEFRNYRFIFLDRESKQYKRHSVSLVRPVCDIKPGWGIVRNSKSEVLILPATQKKTAKREIQF